MKPKSILRCITLVHPYEERRIELPFSKEQIIATMPAFPDGKTPQITIWYVED